jgi:lipoyl(octanoyl) transferase
LVEWLTAADLTPYPEAVARMEARVAAIRAGLAPELVWLVQHPPLYTAGTSAHDTELLQPGRLPVYRTGRGGRFTYHGPGQRVAYVMLDLARRGADVRDYVRRLEEWIIAALGQFGVQGQRRPGLAGVWVPAGQGHAKIAAIGVRVRHWITYHGISLNVAPDLSDYAGIVPCGIAPGDNAGVTSLAALGVKADMAAVDAALKAAFVDVFPTQKADAA